MNETERGALEAANRIMHGERGENDIQLVAGVLFYLLTGPKWKSEWRTGDEWVRLQNDEELHEKIGCWCEPRKEGPHGKTNSDV